MSAPNFRTITIPAAVGSQPGVVPENVHGRFYATVATTGLFFVRADDGSQVEQNAGRRFGTNDGSEFGRLTFYNYTAAAVVVTYYAGPTEYVPDPSVVATIASLTVNVSSQPASTYTKGSGVQTLTTGNSNSYTGLDGSKVRKQIIVRNRSTSAGVLDIKDGSGNIMDSLAAGDPPWTLETNGIIQVTANGGNCDYTVGTTFLS